MESSVFLGLGSNKGNKIEYLKKAVYEINKDDKCSVLKCSSVYESKPLGVPGQNNFFNAVIQIKTGYSASELFQKIKNIEKTIGRTENIKWGPREIDIDLLFYGSRIISDENLSIPHKEILNRDFVIEPLLEIAPDIKYPGSNEPLKAFKISGGNSYIINKFEENFLNIS